MLERINHLSSFMNVSSSESALAAYILNFFLSKGFSATLDCNGSIIVRIDAESKTNETKMICTPIDVPGFIALYLEGKKAYLTPTNKCIEKDKTLSEVCDTNGRSYFLKESKSDKKEFFIESETARLGDVYRAPLSFYEQNGALVGKYASLYALIDLLMEISNNKPKDNLLLCFTTSFHTNATTEANIAFREKPTSVLMLGTMEANEKNPLVLLKNGKNFASPKMVDFVCQTAKKNGFKIEKIISKDEITKESSVFSACQPNIISLALPYKKGSDSKESILFKTVDSFKTLILEYFNY